MKFSLKKLLVFCLLLGLVQCSAKNIASNITSQIFVGAAPAFEMENDVQLAEQTGVTLIKMIEALHFDNPNNENYLLLLSRSYGNYGFGFLEWNMLKYENRNEELYELNRYRANDFYQKGKEYGLRILTKHSAFQKGLDKDIDMFREGLRSIGKRDKEALFWTAFNWGNQINLNKDSPIAIAEYPKVEAMMMKVFEMDPNFFYAGPHLFFAVSLGSRPAMFGGDPERSRQHFESALLAYDRKFLMTQTLYAHAYAVQNQDEELFENLLNEVLSIDPGLLPEQRLANEIARLRAQWLLDHKSDFF